ncbi:MAG: hypothetical protein ACQGVK_15940 [Myxococcota bacterium]
MLAAMLRRWSGLLLLCGLWGLGAAPAAAEDGCVAGRYRVPSDDPLFGGRGGALIELTGSTAAIPGVCPAVALELAELDDGSWRIRARWKKGVCGRSREATKLTGSIDATCNEIDGKLVRKKKRSKQKTKRSKRNFFASAIGGESVSYTPPPPIDLPSMGLPAQADGTYLALALPEASLSIDPELRDPVTALGRCADWIVSCATTGGESVDDCIASVRVCETPKPWKEATACCPAACVGEFDERRKGGAPDEEALLGTLGGTCVPGLADMRER